MKNYNTFNRLFDMYEADCRIFEQRVLIHKTLTVNPHAPDLAFAQHPADLFHFGLTEDLLRLWDGRPMPEGVYDFFCRGAGQPNPCRFASRYIIEQYLWVALLEKQERLRPFRNIICDVAPAERTDGSFFCFQFPDI